MIRMIIKRGPVGGASSGKVDKALVRLTLLDESERIDAFVELLRKGTQLNDWDARATRVDEIAVDADIVTKIHAQWTRSHQTTSTRGTGTQTSPCSSDHRIQYALLQSLSRFLYHDKRKKLENGVIERHIRNMEIGLPFISCHLAFQLGELVLVYCRQRHDQVARCARLDNIADRRHPVLHNERKPVSSSMTISTNDGDATLAVCFDRKHALEIWC